MKRAVIFSGALVFALGTSWAENPGRTKANQSIERALQSEVHNEELHTLSVDVLGKRLAAGKAALQLGRPHFEGKQSSQDDIPADLYDQDSGRRMGFPLDVKKQWYGEVTAYAQLQKAVASWQVAYDWVAVKVTVGQMQNLQQVEQALGNLQKYCNSFGNTSGFSECNATGSGHKLLRIEEARVKAATRDKQANEFKDGMLVPSVKLDLSQGHANVLADVTAAGLRIEFVTTGISEVKIAMVQPLGANGGRPTTDVVDCAPKTAQDQPSKPWDKTPPGGGRAPSLRACKLIGQIRQASRGATAEVTVTVASGDSIWLRGELKAVTIFANVAGQNPPPLELIAGAPTADSQPSDRNFKYYGLHGRLDVVGVEALFTKLPKAFLVFAKSEIPCSNTDGLKLQANEVAILDHESNNVLPTVLLTDGRTCTLSLDQKRRDYYKDKNINPMNDLFTTSVPAKILVAKPTLLPTKNFNYIYLDTDMKHNPFDGQPDEGVSDALPPAGLNDPRVKQYNKFRAPIARCVLKDLEKSGGGTGLQVVTSGPNGSVQKVQSLNSLFEDRAYKKCNAKALYLKTALLTNAIRSESLKRIEKALATP